MFGHTEIVESLLAVVVEKNPEDEYGSIGYSMPSHDLGLDLSVAAICRENGTRD